jgi:probable phosphoglycerate mutase
MQGQRPGKLNATGVQQIEELAEALRDVHFDAVVSSDLQRSYDSAMIIAARRTMDVVTTPLLRERDWGDFTGRYILDLKGLPMPDNVETMDEMLKRARAFLYWVKEHYPDQTVLAVGHGIINKAIQAVHYGLLTREIPKMSNAEYRILQL